MLPDYPEVKKYAHAALIRAVRLQMEREEPILAGIHHSTIHEGQSASLRRADSSSYEIVFKAATAEISIPREEMRRVTAEALLGHMVQMARQFAAQQTQTMFEELRRVTEEVGNTVSAKELGAKEAFLEMERRIEMDFDPVTSEPKNLVLVFHPSQIERLKKLSVEWEKDPEFRAELGRIRQQKIEEWRARENRRQLVD